ncbi:biliverdin-producing heme oxygenase [Dokdonella sp. MW10]|uniref:biliverdin-producing heme oxygenase n=1 Tax=Dokdonella sp. MW10 TaxID=2992926 RepID=UPI003F813700
MTSLTADTAFDMPAPQAASSRSLDDERVSRRLREATRAEHARAEAAPVMRDLFSKGLDQARYGGLLTALYALYAGWEADHAEFVRRIGGRPGWIYRSRAGALARDLEALGLPVPARFASPALPFDGAACWGMLYVIEGSTLGGRIITARLQACMPDVDAMRFFSLGASEPVRWPRFQRVLDEVLADERSVTRAVAGARAFFAAFAASTAEV